MSAGQMILLAAGVLLAAASSGFSAIETAVFSMTEERRRKLRSRNPKAALTLDELLLKPGEMLHALLLADALANFSLIVILLYLLDGLGFAASSQGWAAIGVIFAVVIVVCDLIPKLAALAMPVRLTRIGLPIVRALLPLLQPTVAFLQRISEAAVAALIPARIAPLPHLTEEELRTLIEIGRAEGTLSKAESSLILEVMKLADEPARHCMTPRVDMFIIPDNLSNAEVAEILRHKRYRRIPMRGESPDDILGIIDVKQFLLRPEIPLAEQLQPPSFVPETMNALALLRAFLKHRQHLAILLDEYGGIEGMVTLSDLIEDLFGEEGPDSRSELYIEKLGGDRLLAAGSARLDDLGETLGWETSEENVETIGGLVVEHLGFLPKAGTMLAIDGWRVTVRRATRKRIKEVLIEPAPEHDEPGNQTEEAA